MTKRFSVVLAGLSLGLTLAIGANCYAAEPAVYGDWSSGTGDDGTFVYAATANDSGELLGEYCYFTTKTCFWFIGMHSKCKPGDNYTVLANSEASAVPLTVNCKGPLGQAGLYTMQFASWKDLESNIASGSRVGFAVPLDSGLFTAVRFSLNGRLNSTSEMERDFFKQAKKRLQNTSDQEL